MSNPEDWYGNYYQHDKIDDGIEGITLPTATQMQELISNTESWWVKDHNGIIGLNGRIFAGKNGNSIFIPAAGRDKFINHITYDGIIGYYWSSTKCKNDKYNFLYFYPGDIFVSKISPYFAYPLRAII